MTDLDRLLGEALDDLAAGAPHSPHLADEVRRRASRGRSRVLAAAAAVTLLAGAGVALAAWPDGEPAPPVTASTCGPVETGVLPEWARAGFSEPEPSGIPFVRSQDGDLVAILFGHPLASPPVPGRSNKVLWVPRVAPGEEVRATARLDGTGPAVAVDVPAFLGPSGIDLPSPGCWRVDVSWDGVTRSVHLPYTAGRPEPEPVPGAGSGTG